MFKRLRGFAAALLAICTCVLVADAGTLPAARVTLGDEVFLQETWQELGGRCVGVITNQTGVTSHLVNIVDAIRQNPQICIKAIYSPEHGLRGDRPAGAYVGSYTDARTGLPVYSLYGPQRHPTRAMLEGVDVLLFDIQDVGSRTYTYISTMAYAMQAAKDFNKEMWILDRPNPVGGTMVEGPVLDPRYKSFIGLYPIAMRHGMTVGELARMFNGQFNIGARLRVIPMRGWHRRMLWPDTGLQWIQTSPNMPEWSTALVYPCTGLIDNVGLSGGIGSTKPFKYAGAPGLDAYAVAAAMNALNIPGVFFRPAYWSPLFGPRTGAEFGGVELVVYDPRVFPAVSTAVQLIAAVQAIQPDVLHVNAKALAIDWGTDALGSALTPRLNVEALESGWQPQLNRFLRARRNYLLYE